MLIHKKGAQTGVSEINFLKEKKHSTQKAVPSHLLCSHVSFELQTIFNLTLFKSIQEPTFFSRFHFWKVSPSLSKVCPVLSVCHMLGLDIDHLIILHTVK